MPISITGLRITEDSPTSPTVTVQIGSTGYDVARADLFDRSSDPAHLKNCIRLAFQIGPYAYPDSDEFIGFINRDRRGLKGKDANYFIRDVTRSGDPGNPTYTFLVGASPDTAATGIDMSDEELRSDYSDQRGTILDNLVPFFRVGGFASVADAATALENAIFRY